jgi:type I restriction enzyme S subunit
MSWEKYKLGDILERKREKVDIVPDENYKLVTIKLHHKGVILRHNKKGADIKSNMHRVKEGDFVLSGIDARNGAFGIVPKELDNAIVTNDFWCLEPKKDILRKDFFLFITSTSFFDYICNQCSDGTTQRIRLQKDKFYNYELTLPPVEQQEILVKNLTLNKVRSTNISTELSHQLDLVKQLRQSFLREAMQGKLIVNDKLSIVNESETGAELLAKIKAEKEQLIKDKKIKKQKTLPPITKEEIPFEIPENWVWCRLGVSGNLLRGKSKHRPRNDNKLFSNGKYAFIQTGDVARSKNNGYIINTINGYYNDFGLAQSKMLEKGTLCITIAANIAETGFLDFNACAPDSIVYFKGISKYIDKYVFYFIRDAQKELEKYAPATSQKNINLGILNSLVIPFPPLSEQKAIVKKLDELMTYCDSLEQSIKNSQSQNKMLLGQVLREALEPASDKSTAGKPKEKAVAV